MGRLVPVLVVALALIVAGCVGQSAGTTPTPTPTGTETTTGTPTPTTQITPTSADPVAVEYVVRAGTVPDDLRSVNVTLQVIFVETTHDLGPCWRGVFYGPYAPTVTPIATPSGECHRSKSITIDLTGGNRSLGRITAPGTFAAGHGLVVTDVTATYRNGTTTTEIKGTGGHVVNVVEGRPDGPYRVELALEPGPDQARYEYWFVSELVEPPE